MPPGAASDENEDCLLQRPRPSKPPFGVDSRSVQCLFSPPQLRHPRAQLFQREQRFLIGSDQALHALARTRQIALQRLLASFVGAGVSGSREPSFDFRLDKARVFEELEDFTPHQMIEQILANGMVITQRTIQM